MIIGVLKEIKANEFRVAAVPETVAEIVAHGHQVLVQKDAGLGSGYSDAEYAAAGAVILSDPCGGGYYLSDDPEELRRFTRTLNARARNTLRAAESAQRALDAATGQERMDGWW